MQDLINRVWVLMHTELRMDILEVEGVETMPCPLQLKGTERTQSYHCEDEIAHRKFFASQEKVPVPSPATWQAFENLLRKDLLEIGQDSSGWRYSVNGLGQRVVCCHIDRPVALIGVVIEWLKTGGKDMSELNPTGTMPVQYRVLVLPDNEDEETSGGIFIPITMQNKEREAMERGVLIEASKRAFTGAAWEGGAIPKVGDHIIFSRYAGATFLYPREGHDRKTYRLINDEDVTAITEIKG